MKRRGRGCEAVAVVALALAVAGCGAPATSGPALPAASAAATQPVTAAAAELAVGGLSCPGLEETERAPEPAPAVPPGCPPLPPPVDHVLVPQLGGFPWQEVIAYGPTGSVFATAARDGAIRVWDGQTAQLRQTLRGPTGRLRPVGFRPSSTELASTCAGTDVWVWDLETGRSRKILDLDAPLYAVDYDPGGTRFATSHEGRLGLWTAEGAPLSELAVDGARHAWSPDGSLLVTFVHHASLPQRLALWRVAGGEQLWSLERPYVGQGAGDAAWRADGRQIAWLADDRSVEVVDVATGAVARRLEGEGGLSDVGWSGEDVFASSPDGLLLAWDVHGARRSLAGDDCRHCRFSANQAGTHALAELYERGQPVLLRLFDLSGRQPPRGLKLPFDPGFYAAWHPDGRHVAVVSARATPAVIDVVSAGTQVGTATVRGAWTMAWSPKGDALASIHGHESRGWENEIRIWDAESGALRASIAGRERGKGDSYDGYTHLAWSPAGDLLAAGSMRQIDLYRASGRFERNVETRSKYPTPQTMAFSADGRRLAVVGGDLDTVRIYDPRVGIVGEHQGHVGNIFAVAFSPDGKRVALGGGHQLCVLDTETGRSLGLFEGNFRVSNAIAWLDGNTFLSGHEDGSVLRIAVEGEPTVFAAHRGAIRALALSADRKLLATGGVAGDLKVWRADSMELVSTRGFDQRGVQALAWHPRAPVLAVASYGPIHLLRVSDDAWLDLHLVHVASDDHYAALALAPGGLFNGDEQAFFYVRWLSKEHRATGPVRWYDTVPGYRRETLVGDLVRGCPLYR